MGEKFDLNYYKRDQDGIRLDFAKKKQLYGRDAELKILHEAVTGILPHETINERVQSKPRRACLVHGLSGSGKTSLCNYGLSLDQSELQPYRLTEKAFYIEGKYNQLYTSTTAPYEAIVNAFDMLGQQLKEMGGFSAEMKECLKYEGAILTKLIPSFGTYETKHDESITDDTNRDSLVLASERLAIAFRSFLRKFTIRVRPLIFFLDDLQWSDQYSQELIASILHDIELQNFLFVAAFRDDDSMLTASFLGSVEDLSGTGIIEDIKLNDLDQDSVVQLLSGTLSSEMEATESLGTVVHRKTNGNPYFVTQLLEQLHAQKFLSYNFATLAWEWDIDMANAGTDVSENVADVVTRRLQGIPSRVQRVLKLAACLGYFVDVGILKRLDLNVGRLGLLSDESERSLMEDLTSEQQAACQDSKEASERDVGSADSMAPELNQDILNERFESELFEAALKRAEEEAFVERTGGVVKFSHDRIQQCVYELVEAGRVREMLHYEIGRYLRNCHEEAMDSEDSSRFLFLAVDQLNRGSALIDNDEGRISLIKLNYEASKVAKEKAGVEAVARFLRKAIDLVQPSFWLFYYDLVLEVYNLLAEVEYSLGMLEGAKTTTETILQNAVRKLDTVRALVVEYQMYGLRCQWKEAISHGSAILKLLGEPLPKKVGARHVIMEYFRARKACKNKSDDFFTELHPAESIKVKTILKVLQVGSVYGWNGDVNFAGLAFLRGIRITVREGSSDATPYLYSGYGFMCGAFGDYEEAFRFGQLALNTRRCKETFPSACPLTYGNLNHLQLPLSASLEPYLSGYRVGLETGDLFFGSICISCYCLIHLTCGLPLGPFSDDLRNFGTQLQICHQHVPLAFILPTHQLALNLMGRSEDPSDLSRDAIRHSHDLFSDNLLHCDESTRIVPADVLYLWYLQLYNAYILEDVGMSERTLKRILALKNEARRFGGTHMMNYFLPFMDGLVGLWLAKVKPKSRTGPRAAKAAIAELRGVSKTRPVNSVTPLQLLQAEVQSRKKSTATQEARKAYTEAISQFSRSGLNHFSAIGNELAGKYMLERGETSEAEVYLTNAVKKWDEYNAHVKVDLMIKQYPFLQRLSDTLHSGRGTSIQGRARFDATLDSFRRASSSKVDGGAFDEASRSSFRASFTGSSMPSLES